MNQLLSKYTDERFKRESAIGYLSDISIKIEKQRRSCEFDIFIQLLGQNLMVMNLVTLLMIG
jgi:hypothetical protein